MATSVFVRSRTPRIEACRVLLEDPDLAAAVTPEQRPRAIDECLAPVLRLPRRPWEGGPPALGQSAIGMLVLDGVLMRRVHIGGRPGGELLGEGDLIRPWQQVPPSSLDPMAEWRVIEPTRLALLDHRVAQRLARHPEVTARLVARVVERTQRLAMRLAIVHQARIDRRVHMLMWLLAERWGRVGPDGISLRLRLTHGDLADLVAARRPSVTTALARLASGELVLPLERGWLLRGEPPGPAPD